MWAAGTGSIDHGTASLLILGVYERHHKKGYGGTGDICVVLEKEAEWSHVNRAGVVLVILELHFNRYAMQCSTHHS